MIEPVVTARGLTQVYGHGANASLALDVDAFDVWSGEVVILEGPSGSGKTTLLSILGTLLTPTTGTLAIGGAEVRYEDHRQLEHLRRDAIGFVFQASKLLGPLSAVENVEVALDIAGWRGRGARDRAEEVLWRVGLEEKLHARVGDLSGGQRQRVAVARALANDPPLLLCDEPTAALDSKNGAVVGGLLAGLAREGRAIVVATHDPRLDPFGTRCVRLVDGQVVPRAA